MEVHLMGEVHAHLRNNGLHDWADAMPISGTSVRDCAEAFFRGGVRQGATVYFRGVGLPVRYRLGIQHLLLLPTALNQMASWRYFTGNGKMH